MTAFLHWLLLVLRGPITEVDEATKADLRRRVEDHERRLKILERERQVIRGQ